jgi:hypothetical protein
MRSWHYSLLVMVVSVWGVAAQFQIAAVNTNVNTLRIETKRMNDWNETHRGDPWGHRPDRFGLDPGDPRGRLKNEWRVDEPPKNPAEVKPGDQIPPQKLPIFFPPEQVEIK